MCWIWCQLERNNCSIRLKKSKAVYNRCDPDPWASSGKISIGMLKILMWSWLGNFAGETAVASVSTIAAGHRIHLTELIQEHGSLHKAIPGFQPSLASHSSGQSSRFHISPWTWCRWISPCPKARSREHIESHRSSRKPCLCTSSHLRPSSHRQGQSDQHQITALHLPDYLAGSNLRVIGHGVSCCT